MTENAPTRFPLAWPTGRPRTKNPKTGQFSYRGDATPQGWRPLREITMAMAVDRLDSEIERLGGTNVLLSTDVETRLDGRPRGGLSEPADPGACVYFTLKGKPVTMACDSYTRVAQNIAALAAHIEATRKIERLGVATAAEVLQNFTALPPPPSGPAAAPARPWREVLQVGPQASIEVVQASYRALAKAAAAHGSALPAAYEATLRELNLARDQAIREIG